MKTSTLAFLAAGAAALCGAVWWAMGKRTAMAAPSIPTQPATQPVPAKAGTVETIKGALDGNLSSADLAKLAGSYVEKLDGLPKWDSISSILG